MRTILLVVFLQMLFYKASSQNCKTTLSCSCDMIQSILNNKELTKHFYLKNISGDTLIVVDSFKVFSACKSKFIGNVFTVFVDSFPNEIKKGDASYKSFKGRPNLNMLVFEEMKKNNKGYIIRLWQPTDNASAQFKLNQRNNKIAVISKGVY